MMRVVTVLMVLVLGTPTGVLAAARQPDVVQVPSPLRRSIEREAIRLARQPAAAAAPQASRQMWAERHAVLLGMIIGLAGGIAVGTAQSYEGKRPFGPFIVLGGGMGTGIGAGVGAIITAAKR